MNDIPKSDPLLWEALPDLTLNIAQTAALCGISVRQLGYWTRQGYVDAQGQGVRRTYGLPAIQRLLTIRRAMEAGLSLRQSLRQIAAETPAAPTLPLVLAVRQPDQSKRLAASLMTFFEANSHTRDHAGGLAVKLGWAEDDVRAIADSLCASGALVRDVCQGMTIFYRPSGGESHA